MFHIKDGRGTNSQTPQNGEWKMVARLHLLLAEGPDINFNRLWNFKK